MVQIEHDARLAALCQLPPPACGVLITIDVVCYHHTLVGDFMQPGEYRIDMPRIEPDKAAAVELQRLQGSVVIHCQPPGFPAAHMHAGIPQIAVGKQTDYAFGLHVIGYSEVQARQALCQPATAAAPTADNLIAVIRPLLAYHLAYEPEIMRRLDAEAMRMSYTAQPNATTFNPFHSDFRPQIYKKSFEKKKVPTKMQTKKESCRNVCS